MLAGYGGSSPLAAQSDLSVGRGSGGPGHSGTPARPEPAPTPTVFPPTGPSLSQMYGCVCSEELVFGHTIKKTEKDAALYCVG